MPLACAKVGCLLALFAGAMPGQRMADTYPNLQAFIDACPQNDPYLTVIQRDFQILRDKSPVGPIACTEPYSQMPPTAGTDELIVLQTLRFAYYMDMGRSEYLPWTPPRLYDWFKSRVSGIDIDTTLDPNSVAASCCENIDLGYSCDSATQADSGNAFAELANVEVGRCRDNKPPMLTLPAASGGSCIAAVSFRTSNPPTSPISAAGGTSTLGIVASNESSGWTADSGDSWIFPALGTNSTGTAAATYGFTPNPSASMRTGTLIAAGLSVPITQAGCSGCAPTVSIDGVASGAASISSIASGSWVAIYGHNLSTTTRLWGSADFSSNRLPRRMTAPRARCRCRW